MSASHFKDLPAKEQEWLQDYLDGTIEKAAFESLQQRMLEDPKLRAIARNLLSLDAFLFEKSHDVASLPALDAWAGENTQDSPQKIIHFPAFAPIAAAAAILFLLSFGAIFLIQEKQPLQKNPVVSNQEPSAEGFAVIENIFDATWPSHSSSHHSGDVLGSEIFQLTSGTAEIRFFSGAMMIVEGPAQIALKSAWEASCVEGAIRMRVPPAARGFKLHAPSSEIIDLGTEFGLHVREGKAHVEVFDGEISLRHRQESAVLLTKGTARGIYDNQPSLEIPSGKISFPEIGKLNPRANQRKINDFARWEAHRNSLATRKDLLAYYTFDSPQAFSLIPDLTIPRNPESDGALILAESVNGRWPDLKSALEFRRPGSRVRVSIPGEFSALTFFTWVRIDSLDRLYNALFMGDGYETGEPHWQINNKGEMMLSVMVDHTAPHPLYPTKTRYHYVYRSPPMWDRSKSGQWMNLASVFDPTGKTVSHYVDGKQISQQAIEPMFKVTTLRIGNAEIGNWGQPFREDPTFAIRHLNGRMDEIALFRSALTSEEIAALYESSRVGRR